MQIAAIPSGPTSYQPVSAVPPVAPVSGKPSDGADGQAGARVRSTPPTGVGTLLDILA